MGQNIYFLYEPNTGHYLRGVFADTKPAYSTELEPTGLVDAVFNTDTNKWEGASIADRMADAKKAAATNIDPRQQQMAQMYQTFMQQQALASARDAKNEARIKALEEELKGGK